VNLTDIIDAVLQLSAAGLDRTDIVDVLTAQDIDLRRIGETVFWRCPDRRDDPACYQLPAWPRCQCTACGCNEIATTTDETDTPLCDACEEYVVDEDGTIYCERCPEVEVVAEACGPGTLGPGAVRTYLRLRPPDPPEEDPDGEWACCWESCGEVEVISRHTTREEAEQAVAAHDWPPPEDHTLCGYVVRYLSDDGEWVVPED